MAFIVCSSQKMSYLCHRKRLCLANGTLDEWLSQWSAKPCTAVRIRQVPQKEFHLELLFYLLEFSESYSKAVQAIFEFIFNLEIVTVGNGLYKGKTKSC